MKRPTLAKTALVVTTIAKPQRVLRTLALGCQKRSWDFFVVGDVASPRKFNLKGCEFYDLKRQIETGFKFARLCPTRHYSRKNIGYLLAMRAGAQIIVETDDDNFPLQDFWQDRKKIRAVKKLHRKGWVNPYSHFTDEQIWPRGLPLGHIKDRIKASDLGPVRPVNCPIQQGLCQDNPDVDAIYRLVLPLPRKFRSAPDIALGKGTWSPFNSQNTTWWKEAFPLLYLPSYCSFRMTDIWRSFIAQRIAAENHWPLVFHTATMVQERNKHDLLKDFSDEVSVYLQNEKIQEILSGLPIRKGVKNIPGAMRLCYSHLVRNGIFGPKEIKLLNSWLSDLECLLR